MTALTDSEIRDLEVKAEKAQHRILALLRGTNFSESISNSIASRTTFALARLNKRKPKLVHGREVV